MSCNASTLQQGGSDDWELNLWSCCPSAEVICWASKLGVESIQNGLRIALDDAQ